MPILSYSDYENLKKIRSIPISQKTIVPYSRVNMQEVARINLERGRQVIALKSPFISKDHRDDLDNLTRIVKQFQSDNPDVVIFDHKGCLKAELFGRNSEEIKAFYKLDKRKKAKTPVYSWTNHQSDLREWERGYEFKAKRKDDDLELSIFSGNPNYGVGALCGIISNSFTVDLDGPEALRNLRNYFGDKFESLFPVTEWTQTLNQGFHFDFSINEDIPAFKPKEIPHVEILSTGNQVVLAGTILPQIGKDCREDLSCRYQILGNNPMVDAPKELIVALRELYDANKGALTYEVQGNGISFDEKDIDSLGNRIRRGRAYIKTFKSISGKGGEKALFDAAQHLAGGFLLPEEHILALLREWNQTNTGSDKRDGIEPWDDDELKSKASRAARWAKKNPKVKKHAVKNSKTKIDPTNTLFDSLEMAESTTGGTTKRIILPSDDNRRLSESFRSEYKDKGLLFDNGSYYLYQGNIYRPQTHSMIFDLMDDHLDNVVVQTKEGVRKPRIVYEGIKQVLSYQFEKLTAAAEREFSDEDDHGVFIRSLGKGISFKNGFVKYDSGDLKLVPHSPNHFALYHVNADFDPDLKCPMFDSFLWDLFEDKEVIESVEEAIGVTINGKAPKYKKAFFVEGASNSGKSQLGFIIQKLLPKYLQTVVPLEKTDDEKYRMKLQNKLLNLLFETSETEITDSKTFKSSVAGDTITGRTLYKMPIEFRPIAAWWMFPNVMPKIHDTTDAVMNRMMIYKCQNVFAEFPEGDQKKQIKDIADIITKAELPAIIIKAMRAFMRIEARGGFKVLQSVKESVDEHRAGVNNVNGFFRDCIEAHSGSSVGLYAAFEEYETYCVWNKIQEKYRKDRTKFGQMFAVEYKRLIGQNVKGERSGNEKIYHDIRIKPNPQFRALRGC